METSISYTTKDCAYFSSDERKWITHILKMKEEHPEDVTIIRYPKDNDGCIYAKVPVGWLSIRPKRKRTLSEEQIEQLRERMKARFAQNSSL